MQWVCEFYEKQAALIDTYQAGISPSDRKRALLVDGLLDGIGGKVLELGAGGGQTAAAIAGIEAALDAAGRSREGFEIVVMPADANADTVKEFQDIGVDRLVPMLVASNADQMNKRIDELAALADAR